MEKTIAIWFNLGLILAAFLFGYLIGSIPNALIIGKLFYKKDPRDYGSHNLGGSNTGRLFGKKVGFFVIVLDMLKTIVPVWAAWAIFMHTPLAAAASPIWMEPIRSAQGVLVNHSQLALQYYYIVALGTIIGHCYPIFAQLRGGKGFSNFIGLVLGVNWFVGLTAGILFFIVLYAKRHVSLASISAAISGSLLSWLTLIPALSNVTFYGPTMIGGLEFAITITLLGLFTIFKHRSNIQRLLAGTERRISWMDSKKEKEAKRLLEEQNKEQEGNVA